jgi:uncharacterized protein YbjQ (UPF0145 family)
MILSTTDAVAGLDVVETLGVVTGSSVRARFFLRDILASIKSLFGGEIATYTAMMCQARDQALVRMIEEGERRGADGIVNVRFTTSSIMKQAAEVLAYGTAVKLRKPGEDS